MSNNVYHHSHKKASKFLLQTEREKREEGQREECLRGPIQWPWLSLVVSTKMTAEIILTLGISFDKMSKPLLNVGSRF